MHHVVFAILLISVAPVPTLAAGGDTPHAAATDRLAPTRTGKEKLSDKGSDEQRVDDCKVPAGRRTRERPVSCTGDLGS